MAIANVADSDRDRFFMPDEARAYGLVDHVIAHVGALPETEQNPIGGA